MSHKLHTDFYRVQQHFLTKYLVFLTTKLLTDRENVVSLHRKTKILVKTKH